MPRHLPLTLHEAVVSLYATGSDGISGADPTPIFLGACAEGIRLASSLTEFEMAATGATHREIYHTDEQHEISFDHVWVIPTDVPRAFRLVRNARYLIEIVWTDPLTGTWHRRTYYGATARSFELASRDLNSTAGEFGSAIAFRAQRYQEQSGGPGEIVVPLSTSPVPAGTPLTAGFFHTAPIFPDDSYLLGHYNWSADVRLKSVRAIALTPPVGTNAVFTLEVGGVLSAVTVTVPAGTLGTESTVTVNGLDTVIPGGSTMRWQLTAGPAALENSPAMLALVASLETA